MTINIFENNEVLAEAFAIYFAEWMREKERVAVALSGGSTPKVLFKHWAEQYRNSISWEKIHFFWGDERCVPPDDPDSNYGVAKALFFDRIDIPEENIHRIRGEERPALEAERYGEEIRQWVKCKDGVPVFDLILLGMGEDGHTASIFPGQMELLTNTNICQVAAHPDTGQQRITLTGPVINSAELVTFLVTGSTKASIVREIVTQADSRRRYPAAFIQPEQGELCWFLDQAAAQDIED